MTKVYIYPEFPGADKGEGGVRRVVEAMTAGLPAFGVEVVSNPAAADVLSTHIMAPRDFYTRYAQKPLVTHNHGFYWRDYAWSGDWAGKANREVMDAVKAADVVTAPSEWVADIIRRHSCRRVVVVHHGVEMPWMAEGDVEPEDRHGGYALWNKTRVDPVCDPLAVRELAARLPGVEFKTTFWADPDDRNPPQLLPNVEVLGRSAHDVAMSWVARAGVYLATTRETFGIGTLEAMAAGVPVVGWDFAGQREIVSHMKDGYLARLGDYDDLALGVRWCLEYREQLFRAARAKAARFPWDKAIEAYADIFRELDEAQHESRPRVSIVVTAYNVAPYLDETLASVHTQATDDWECIVVDDASPDNGLEIATAWADKDERFRVILNETNVNTPEARNIGIREARGRYILPLDGDDILTPQAAGVLADALDRDRTIAVAYGNLLFRREDGAEAHSGWPVEFNLGQFFMGRGQPLPYSSMFRREAWELTGGYRRRVSSSEDCDLWMRFASYGFEARMVTRGDTLIYRIREGSRSDTEGHQDEQNKDWFPWRRAPQLAPAACGQRPVLDVAALEPPRISVIIPCGPGHEQFVLTAIDSVDGQIYREWECIVVNDTGGPLPEMPEWVRVIQTGSKPVGVGMARNLGIFNARASLFVCLDADDYLLTDALLTMLRVHLEGGAGRCVVYADFWEDPDEAGVFKTYQLADYDPPMLLKGGLPSMCLVPVEAWTEVGGYEPNVPWEDWDFQLKLAAAGWGGVRVASPLWVYRKHTGTRRADHFRRRKDAEAVFLERWGEYIRGEKDLMPCTACGGRSKLAIRLEGRGIGRQAPEAAAGPSATAVRIRFTGDQRGGVPIAGPVTRTLYTFSALDPVKYVHASDVEGLLLKRFFEPFDAEEPAATSDPASVVGAAPAAAMPSSAPPIIAHEDAQRRRPAAKPAATQVRHVTQEAADAAADRPATQPFADVAAKTLADLPEDQNPLPPAAQPLPPPPNAD